MAVRADVVLLADGGDVTVSRDAATFVYGEFKVIIPEGREQVETDRRLQDGYIYRPSVDISPFDIGFSRADVTIDLEVQSTDLELVVDQAQRNADGDVFFERDITPAGLGEYVPGVDFQVGDVVSVDLRGRRMLLPVSEISMVSSESDGAAGWHVRVGGVLISDADELRRRYDAVRRQVANDKRELARSAGRAATAASTAQSTANTARSEVQAVRDTLAGEQAQEPDLLSQLVAVNDELQRLGQDPQPSLMLAFVSLSTALWEAQQKINQQQQLINAQQKQINEQTREINEAQSRSIELLSLYNHGALYIESSYVLNAKTWRVLDFSGVRGQLIGCEPIVVQNDNSSGTGLRFLSPGDWEVNLRVTLPPGDAIIGTSTAIRVVALTPGGQGIGTARATSRNSGSGQTLSLRTTVSVPEAGSYVFAQAYASTTSGASSWWPADTGPELTELSVRQLSVLQ